MNPDRITGQRAGWQDIATAPRDGTRIVGWHAIHKCPVAVRHKAKLAIPCLDWVELTMTTSWPEEALSHWMPLPPPPDTEDDITAGLEALKEPIVAEWGEVKDRLNLGKED